MLLEDRRTNRLEESRKIFDTIVNNKIFALISVILFLNKMDLLSTKVPNSDISRHFEDFRYLRVFFFLLNLTLKLKPWKKVETKTLEKKYNISYSGTKRGEH